MKDICRRLIFLRVYRQVSDQVWTCVVFYGFTLAGTNIAIDGHMETILNDLWSESLALKFPYFTSFVYSFTAYLTLSNKGSNPRLARLRYAVRGHVSKLYVQ
jgi:hypothetical protein